MALREKCPKCGFDGAGKGRCTEGHVHCRRCPTYYDYISCNMIQRTGAASGDTWPVYCLTSRMDLTVTEDLRIREAPSGFTVPTGMFRSGCCMISVVVGKGAIADTFVIEEPLLTAGSPYFKNALKQTFKEGLNNRVELEDEDPFIFGLVNEYLHQGAILHEPDSPTMAEYSRLWLFAHYLQIEPLMNYCMWRLLEHMDNGKKLILIEAEELYAQAPMDSILRKFLVQLCVWGEDEEALKPTEDAPQDMLRELVTDFQKKCDPTQKSPLMDVRNYYVGEDAGKGEEEVKAG